MSTGKTDYSDQLDDLRQRARKQAMTRAAGSPDRLSSPEEAISVLHELQIHQIELEMQNEELRRSEQEVAAERARYFELYDLAPVGYLTLNEQDLIISANLTVATLLGVQRDALVKKPFSRYILPEDQDSLYLHRKQLLAKSMAQVWEMRMLRPDGHFFWAHLQASPAPDGECWITLNDISAHKQAEEERLNEARYLAIEKQHNEALREREEQTRRSLQEKEVLLKEIHHRVKNNMQIVCSLLNLQAKGIADPAIRAKFEESRDRVRSMVLIHEKLYGSNDLARIDFNAYLGSLVKKLADTYKRPEITLSVARESITLDVNVGIPCGLIVNELVSNSLKYAFPDGRRGTIKVGINQNSDGEYVLFVEDDGIGAPAGLDLHNTSSLGLRLVTMLTGQINGTIEFGRAAGTLARITFPGTSEKKGDRNGEAANSTG